MSLPIFDDPVWQMSRGERAAVEGVLAGLRPALAIEIGSMEGAGLRRIAAYADEVHSFDLQPPSLEQPANVVAHTGDSHELLPAFLAELAGAGRNVDFVVVDGDHSADGVRQDIVDLLESPAVGRTVVLIHDTANPEVRRGLDAIRFGAWPKVGHVELDWVPGHLFAEPALRNELWFGLGLVLIDAARLAYGAPPVYEPRFHPAGPLLAEVRELVVSREAGVGLEAHLRDRVRELEDELLAVAERNHRLDAELGSLQDHYARAQRALRDILGSPSWRMTEPLRRAKRMLRS